MIPSEATLAALGAWYQDRRGLSSRSWRTCASRVERLYTALSAWYGAGVVELHLLADPAGGSLDKLATLTSNSDFTWCARTCRTPLERRAVMLGGTTTRQRKVILSWLVPTRPLDPGVGRDLTWRGDELAPSTPDGALRQRDYAGRSRGPAPLT